MIMMSSLVIVMAPTDTRQLYRPASASRRGEKEMVNEFSFNIALFFFHWYVYDVDAPRLTEQVREWLFPMNRVSSTPVITTIIEGTGYNNNGLIIITISICPLVLYWQCG